VGGALGGLLHAVATVNFGVDQIVSGVAINVMAPALTRFMSERVFGGEVGGSVSQSPRVTGLPSFTVPVLAGGGGGPDILGSIADANIFWISDIASLLHGVMTQIGVFTVLALAMVPLTAWVLARTRMGLRIKICGENPKAGESLGINIYLHKYIGVMISGALAGIAGAYIVLELTGVYRGGQTTGRGFIGLAALIFGNWKALGVLAGSLLFGYPFGLSLIDFDATSSGGATRSLLLVIAIALAGVAVWAYRADKRLDVGLAVILSGIALVWYLLTDTAAAWLPNTMPYALVLIVLVFASQRLRPPATAGVPFRKGET
jgi:general nucleoside transport system permease protein